MGVKRMRKRTNLNSVHVEDNGYTRLANAIVIQAAKDYRNALKRIKVNPRNSDALHTKGEVEKFFHSGFYSALTSIDPDMLIRKLNEEVQ